MKQEVIQDFLTVPGIAGIALIDGISRPYFHGFGASFEGLQQDVIAQGIQQVLETTPEGFNSFEFQFDFYRIYLHKLKRRLTLLVLTSNALPQAVYTQAVRRVLLELQLEQENPIAAFQAIAAKIPLIDAPSSLPTPQPELAPAFQPVFVSPNSSSNSSSNNLPNNLPNHRSANSQTEEPQGSERVDKRVDKSKQPQPPPENFPPARTTTAASTRQSADLKDVLAAINALNQLTTQYLGTLVVANYWKVTRPPIDWLNYFQIERSAQMTFSVQNPAQPLPTLTAEQHRWLQEWVAAFIERCSKVIRDFAKIARQVLTEQQQATLFHPPDSIDKRG